MPRISFEPLGDSWTLVVALIVALVLCVCASRSVDASASPKFKRFDLILRLIVVALFAIFFVRPSLVRIEKEELPAAAYFICDVSESMSIEDEKDGATRYDAMRKLFDERRDELKALSEKFDVRFLAFGSELLELDVEDGAVVFPDAPTASSTELGASLLDALRVGAGKRVVGTAVFSDGAQRSLDPDAVSPQDAALRYRDADSPITTFLFGSPLGKSRLRDVSIADLRANDRVFVGNELAISGQARVMGYAGREIPLRLEFETESGELREVAETTVAVDGDDGTTSFQFVYKPEEVGEWKYRVSCPVLENELLDTNNALEAFVEAVDGGVNALYIEGTRRYEQNFLRAALDSSSDVRARYWRPPISSLVGKTPNATEAEMVSTLAESRKSLVDVFFGDGKYATYILGDVDASAFKSEELEELAKRVEEGAGLIVLAGERSLGLGGYANTPLADALPVQTRVEERLPLTEDLSRYESGEPETRRARLEGAFRATPVGVGARGSFATSLSADSSKNAELWRSLPPLSSVYRLGAPKPGATTLLAAENSEGASLPLLVVQRYGLGRVAVLATDSTWRWRMRGKEKEHAKFWRQLTMWSAKVDETLEGELAVEIERSRIAPGEKAEFRAIYRAKEGESLDALRVEATVVAPDGTREIVPLVEENGVWRGETTKTASLGDYRVEAVATSTDDPTAKRTARARFLARAQNIELERPGASPETLERVASTTRGTAREREEFGDYLGELLEKRETIVDEREAKTTLYDSRALFAAFVALMTLNWIVRKRRGLA